jgi:hypothetical protein
LIAIALFVTACAGSGTALSTVGDPLGDTGGSAATASKPVNPAPGEPDNGGQVAYRDDARIIRTGSMTLEVSDVATALRTARDAIVGLGGYVGASTTSNDADRPSAEITYRIPAERWEQALDTLRGLSGLTTRS